MGIFEAASPWGAGVILAVAMILIPTPNADFLNQVSSACPAAFEKGPLQPGQTWISLFQKDRLTDWVYRQAAIDMYNSQPNGPKPTCVPLRFPEGLG